MQKKVMQIIREPQMMQQWALARRAEGRRIGFVPTMGFLHEGHLSLVRQVAFECDDTVVSIFVNPIQFNSAADLEAYPQDFTRDCELLEAEGVTVVFAPQKSELYPSGFQSHVTVDKISVPWEGISRPGHFTGVSTVVALLFNIVQPTVAIFGEKDFQQLRLIEQMVQDLRMPVSIMRGALVRESDGLAMSSRNVRLSNHGRKRALSLSAALRAACETFAAGTKEAGTILEIAKQTLANENGVTVEYLALVEEETLLSIDEATGSNRLLLAAVVDGVRLIDNTRLSERW